MLPTKTAANPEARPRIVQTAQQLGVAPAQFFGIGVGLGAGLAALMIPVEADGGAGV